MRAGVDEPCMCVCARRELGSGAGGGGPERPERGPERPERGAVGGGRGGVGWPVVGTKSTVRSKSGISSFIYSHDLVIYNLC